MRIIEHHSFGGAKAKRLFRIAALSGAFLLAGLTVGQVHQPFAIPAFISVPFSLMFFTASLKGAISAWQGQRGEDLTSKTLAALGDEYCLIRNLQLGEKQGDIDFILIGPFGALVIEQKAISVPIRCQGDKWSYQVSPTFWKYTKSYSRQLKRNVKAVAKRIKAPCIGVVVFNDSVDLKATDPTVDILRRRDLLNFVRQLPHKSLNPETLTAALAH